MTISTVASALLSQDGRSDCLYDYENMTVWTACIVIVIDKQLTCCWIKEHPVCLMAFWAAQTIVSATAAATDKQTFTAHHCLIIWGFSTT